ncbi:MAG: glycosyltransferase [Actinobacteria bacterium]|nr:glycosyltransferase [Actinomycetota bacterium]
MSDLPTSSVVISTRDRGELLRDAIASVLAGSHLPDELVVVDQSRVHGELSVEPGAAHTEIRHIASATKGLGRSRNIGIAAARHDVVVIIDDDVVVEADWLEQVLRALVAAGPRAVVTGRILPGVDEANAGRAVSVKTDERPETHEGRIGFDVLFGNNMAFRRSVTEEIGLFDERLGPGGRYGSADDNDFGFRLLEAGYRIHYAPQAVLRHLAWRSGKDLRKLNWDYGRGQGAFYAKHSSLRDPHMLWRLGDLLRERAVRIGGRPARRRSIGGHGDLVYSAGALSAFAEWLVVERLLPAAKTVRR